MSHLFPDTVEIEGILVQFLEEQNNLFAISAYLFTFYLADCRSMKRDQPHAMGGCGDAFYCLAMDIFSESFENAQVSDHSRFDFLQFREVVEILVAMVGKAAAHPSCQMVQHQLTQLSNVMLQIQLFSSTCIGRSQGLFRKLEYRCPNFRIKAVHKFDPR